MGTSGNPQKKAQQKAQERQISAVGDFKKRLGGVIELPSGLTVKVRNPGGMRVFMNSGIIPNSLMGIVEKGLNSSADKAASELVNKDGGLDPQMLKDMTKLMDDIALKVIVEPQIHAVPLGENDEPLPAGSRGPDEDETLYVDELPDDDKMFLFQWVSGGTRDVESFRQKHAQSMGTLAAVAGDTPTPQ